MLDQQKITILYCRLSNEDQSDQESNSIQNQRTLLTTYAQSHGYNNIKVLVDDGYTGTNFNRPGVQEGFELVKQGLVGTWIVKDMSRFGRDYLTVGQYTELIFPSFDVRFIAINDGVDSAVGDTDGFTAIRNLFNEWYPKDTSKKVRAVLRQKGMSGQHIGKPPYGYQEDPERKGYWIVDPEAAAVVAHIFDLSIAGKGPDQIARHLEKEQVLTTRAYYAKRKGKPLPDKPHHWNNNSIVGILERREYTGCTCNFKTYSKSYKLKKRIPNDEKDMFILEDTQEAIVPKVVWDRVQELRKNKRRPVKAQRQGLFSGLLFCSDCGSKLHFATCKSFDGKQDHYVCAQYKSGRGDCSAHYIREDVLREITLERIQAVNAYVRQDVEHFREEWLRCRRKDQERSIRDGQKRLKQAKKRLDDLDRLIQRLYEDQVLGNLSMERYKKMSAGYESEQEQLRLEIADLEGWVNQQQEMDDNLDSFIALVNKYVDVTELNQTIVNEYIHKIIVHAPDKSSGHRVQKVEIVWNFLEEVGIPSLPTILNIQKTLKAQKTA
jgi:DNA invertase Pin-like site-specific DNA recombinase